MLRRLSVVFPLLSLAVLAGSSVTPAAGPITDERGMVGLQLVLRKLAVTGTVMHVTAHPDDENNSLLAMQSHGQGLRVILATATRGNGGQNEIGPELFEALGVLRSEELRAAHRFDGAEQMFGRAIDFGYSFSVDETFRKWGKDEILGDYVRLIRMTRPDVMITMRPDLHGGGQHHQASAIIGLEAFRAAADPNRYPGQIKEGLRPWQAPSGRVDPIDPRCGNAPTIQCGSAPTPRTLKTGALGVGCQDPRLSHIVETLPHRLHRRSAR